MKQKLILIASLIALLTLAACSRKTSETPPPSPTETAVPTNTPTEEAATVVPTDAPTEEPTAAPTTPSPTAMPPSPTPFPEIILNPFAHILGPTPAPDGWRVEPCDGQAAFLCIFNGEAIAGFAELLVFPLENQTILLDELAKRGLTPGSIDTNSQEYRTAVIPVLQLLIADQLASAEADRAFTYGDSWRFMPLNTEAIQFGRLPGLAYGFVSLDEDDVVIERYITFVTFDANTLYFLGATSDPAAVSNFTNDADLVTFAPYLRQIVAGLDFPSPILGETTSEDEWTTFEGIYLIFSAPPSWNPTQQELFGGSVLEEWRLGIPGVESDQSLGFSAVPFEALQPNDIAQETTIEIDGFPGKKWIRSGEGYVSYDYYTTNPNGEGSFGVHVTVATADSELEKTLDRLVQTIQFK